MSDEKKKGKSFLPASLAAAALSTAFSYVKPSQSGANTVADNFMSLIADAQEQHHHAQQQQGHSGSMYMSLNNPAEQSGGSLSTSSSITDLHSVVTSAAPPDISANAARTSIPALNVSFFFHFGISQWANKFVLYTCASM